MDVLGQVGLWIGEFGDCRIVDLGIVDLLILDLWIVD
jgi:hypothetical protein